MNRSRMRPRHAQALLLSLVLSLLAVSSRVASAQEVARRTGAPLSERLAPATRATIERLADSLGNQGLPAFALRDKAAEGVLKGADDARILSAVASLAARLRESRALLGESARDDELIASASALYAGVPASGIGRLAVAQRQRAAGASLSVPLAVLAELASSRVPSDVALSTVDALLARGARDSDFGAFRISVERDIRQGRAPRDAATTGMQSTLKGIGRAP